VAGELNGTGFASATTPVTAPIRAYVCLWNLTSAVADAELVQ
jgi:hypothetical protein